MIGRRDMIALWRTTVFIARVLPMVPAGLIDRLTPAPRVELVHYPQEDRTAAGHCYLPAGAGPHPGVVVCLGVVPVGETHPQVDRLGQALARAGFAALLYWSPAMRQETLAPNDAMDLARAYAWLIARPEVDPARSGFIGTCVGGAFALLAAAQPAIREQVTFVCAWAPFAAMDSFVTAIASRAIPTPAGGWRPWAVDPLTWTVYCRTLTLGLPQDEAARLRTVPLAGDATLDVTTFSAAGQTVAALLQPQTPEAAAAAIAALPADWQERLAAMSPLRVVHTLAAPLVVIAHDRNDTVIPITESHRLVAALGARPGVHFTEFAMFQHLDPTKVHVSPGTLVVELGKFARSVYPLFRQAVA